jgi:hypothetical protein
MSSAEELCSDEEKKKLLEITRPLDIKPIYI